MYVCDCHQLSIAPGQIVRKGDPVPDFEKWDESVKRAHLRMGNIIKVPEPTSHQGAVTVETTLSDKATRARKRR